jgi:Arc/MetJ-type ribon-helix-helix transcriptional regulator
LIHVDTAANGGDTSIGKPPEAAMAIVLSPELEQQIEEIVRSGDFASAEEFIRSSLERYRQNEAACQEQLAELRDRENEIEQMLAQAEDDVRHGRVTVYDRDGLKALAAEIKAEGRKRLESPLKRT